MQRVIILGAGGHAQVVADVLQCMAGAGGGGGGLTVVGYLDDNPALAGRRFLGLPVLGPLAALADVPHDVAVPGIGDNRTRQRLFERLAGQGEVFGVARHPHSIIAADVAVGAGTVVCAGVVVNTGSRIGTDVILNTACSVDHHNAIGDHVHIAPGTHLGGDVTIGAGTLVGIGATVLPQRSVGAWCVVAAGAVVTKDIPSHCVAAGAPARVIRRLDRGGAA